uniref:28S ribosomal protein S18a, mitochondrial n=1 Tax=Steinernema glaseri TaxID=37863 RepID=A0A1I7YNM0_9BILA
MLSLHLRNGLKTACRQISSTASLSVKRIQETVEGDTTVVELVDAPARESKPVLATDKNSCSLCTCNMPVQLSYRDVLILEQFMRADGTVLPRQHTGLCPKQQLKVERCVMQAHWAGLFPDRTIPEFDRAGYKRFNRYWDSDMAMYQLKQKTEPGTWYYIKRYNSKGNGTYAKKAPA